MTLAPTKIRRDVPTIQLEDQTESFFMIKGFLPH